MTHTTERRQETETLCKSDLVSDLTAITNTMETICQSLSHHCEKYLKK
jgi:hypothetical protein